VFAALTLAAAALAPSQQIQVQVDGNPVYFAGTAPQYVNGRVLVPLRGVFEQMGASVSWDPANRLVSAIRGSDNVQLHIGDRLATVNGTGMTLDVPAMIVNGSTMVPIRFVSEALGAQVGWMEANRLVSITTSATNTGTITSAPQRLRRVMVRANTVVPVTLDHTISTVDNRRGDKFTGTVRTDSGDEYASIPAGTKVEGHIMALRARNGNNPALLELAFDRLRFPNGRSVKIDGSLIAMDDNHVMRNSDGTLVVNTNTTQGRSDQRMVYAGYGAGAGLLIGLLNKKPLEYGIAGGALGYLLGQLQHDQRRASDITLKPGTEMGVRMNQDVAVSWR